MKKLWIISLFSAFSYLGQAQSSTYHAFKIDFDFGYAVPPGQGINAGVSLELEPHYRLSDEFAIGFRIGGAFLEYEKANNLLDFSSLGSYSFTGDYYLSKDGFRPFIGAGIGLFVQEYSFGNNSSGNLYFSSGKTNVGYFPRVGFEVGHFRLSATYNFAGNNSDYADFAVGFFLGGGKKK